MPELHKAGVAYLITIANFYWQSHGFTKFYNHMYAFWKCLPLLVLIAFTSLHGGGLPSKTRTLLTVSLFFGVCGDYLIGVAKEGIVPGAICFGVGHGVYMSTFVYDQPTVIFPLAAALILYNLIIGSVCILPMLKVSVVAVLILAVYSVLLTSCLLFAASQWMNGTKTQGVGSPALMWRLLAYTLFFISDNILILDHTAIRVPLAEKLILFTYFASQYLLVRATISAEKHKIQKNE